MAGSFTLTANAVTLANQAVTVLFFNPPAAPNLTVYPKRFWIGQANGMASAKLRVQLNTQASAFPTLTAATPAKLAGADGASIITGGTAGAAGTAGVNASAEGAGTKSVFWPDTFITDIGWLVLFTPDESVELAAGLTSGIGLHLPVAPGTLTSWTAGVAWLEA